MTANSGTSETGCNGVHEARRAYGALSRQILQAISTQPMTCGEIAQAVSADQQVVSVTVNRLRKRGWVRAADIVRMSTRRICLRWIAEPR